MNQKYSNHHYWSPTHQLAALEDINKLDITKLVLTKLDELKSLHFEFAINHKVHAVTGDLFIYFLLVGGWGGEGGGARKEQGPLFSVRVLHVLCKV